MTRFGPLLLAASLGAATLGVESPGLAASLQQVPSFGANPANAKMFVYVPDKKVDKPPVLVILPYCNGSASAMFTGTGFKGEADLHGFIAIYAQTGSSDGCWDVHSTQSLGHESGGDSSSVVSMVRYAITQYAADAQRVYATGISSGAMMTNVLLGAYPEVFRGGAIFAGVPYACFAGASAWNSNCADGKVTKTGAEWGDLVRAASPGYAGTRPRVQIWHGTSDETLDYHNFGEEIKQWTNVLGVSEAASSTEMNQPQAGYTRTRYADAEGVVRVEAVSEANQPHALMVPAAQVTKFFGLDGDTDPGGGSGGGGTGGVGTGGAGSAGMSDVGGAGMGGRAPFATGGMAADSGGRLGGAGMVMAAGRAPVLGRGGSAGAGPRGGAAGGATTNGSGGRAGNGSAGGASSPPERPLAEPPPEAGGCSIATRAGVPDGSFVAFLLASLALARRRSVTRAG